jgi:3-oxoadipate enol-lactonase
VTENTLEHEGCTLHYWLSGPADRPLVVFTHGVMMDHRLFDAQVPVFSRDYRVLVWDVRGHGLSRPYGDRYSIPLAADDLAAILDRVGAGQVILVGHSMGGYISQEFILRHPSRVKALAVVGSTCLTCRQFLTTESFVPVIPFVLRLLPNPVIRYLTGWGAGVRRSTRRQAREISRGLTHRDRVRFWQALARGYHHEPGYRINRPLLLTHGRYDVLVGFGLIPLLIRRWVKQEPDARYAVIPRAGHNALQDNPEFFNALLLDFLTQNGFNKDS